jgi:hypothetical protein
VRNLHLLAEGLGCSAVASALDMLRTEMTSLGQLQVIFAYVDIDVDSFKETAAAVAPRFEALRCMYRPKIRLLIFPLS